MIPVFLPISVRHSFRQGDVFQVSAGYDAVIRFWDISGGHTKRTLKYEDNPELKAKLVHYRLIASRLAHQFAGLLS